MKYKSMEDLRNLSDKEVEDFLKKYWKTETLTFYGVFIPNGETPDKFSGTMTKVKVPGSQIFLKYPLADIGVVSFKIPANQKLAGKYFKFSCRLLPSYNNRCQLQILLNTLTEIDSRTYHLVTGKQNLNTAVADRAEPKAKEPSPLTRRYQILDDEETGWGRNISQLIGVYKKQGDGTYCLEDIRKTDLTRLERYPRTTFNVGPLVLQKPIEGLDEGQCCLFNWKFTFASKVNPCEIEVDESKPIIFISPKDLITSIAEHRSLQTVAEHTEGRQSDVVVLIYDLLHEADLYCGKATDVQISLTDKHLSFQHTGRPLSAETILYLCGLGSEIPYVDDKIMYHCRGLREFLLANEHTIIVSNGFTIRFDNDGGRLSVVWLDHKDLPRELKISLSRNKRFTETVILPFDGKKEVQNNYKVGLRCVFEDTQNIAFFSNIGKVTVRVKGSKAKTLDRKEWIVSREYKAFIPKEKRPKLIDKKETAIMFACSHKGKELIGEEESPAYSLIPTTSSFGFPFLMQMDIHINKTNYTINHRDSWNKVYAEIAGRLFAKWITDLTVKAEFTSESIYAIVPKFDECIDRHPEEKTFISLFQKGFKEVILEENDGGKPAARRTNKKDTEVKTAQGDATPVRGNVYVIDTNIFVNCPNIISKMGKNDTVILSAKVIDELDNLKYKLEAKDLRNVQKALKNINVAIDKGKVRMEMSDISLLPRDFDRHNPDNNILSVVLRHKSESPTLLTSDNGLQIKAKAMGIKVTGLKEFQTSKRK